jgi:hypothetical protein
MCLIVQYQTFGAKYPFKKYDLQQKQFLQDLGVLVIKSHLSILFVTNTWLKHCIMQELCFFQESSFHNMCWSIWYRGLNKNMFCQNLENIILPQQVLTYKCLREHMTFLLL